MINGVQIDLIFSVFNLWGAEPGNIPYIFPWSVGLFIRATRLFIWSTRLFLWSTRLFIWSTKHFLYGQLDFLYGQLNTFYMVNFRIFNDVHNALRPKSNKDGCQQGRRALNLLGVCHCQTGPRGHWELAEQGHSKCGSVDRDKQLFNELYFVFKLGVDCSRACAMIPKLQRTWSNE